MATTTDDRPFTRAINKKRLQDGMRFVDLEAGCSRARSTGWFNNLVNGTSPWVVNPPSRDAFEGLCLLFNVDEQLLRQWIATEWYGIKLTEQSMRVVALGPSLDRLSPEDAELVATLIARLTGEAVTVSAAA